MCNEHVIALKHATLSLSLINITERERERQSPRKKNTTHNTVVCVGENGNAKIELDIAHSLFKQARLNASADVIQNQVLRVDLSELID